MSNGSYIDSDTYDLRTCETKQADRITALEKRVDELSAIIYGSGINAPTQLPYGRAGVLITRNGGAVHAQHIVVDHTPLLNADDGIRALRTGNVAFVDAMAAGVVLDALGVKVDEHKSA